MEVGQLSSDGVVASIGSAALPLTGTVEATDISALSLVSQLADYGVVDSASGVHSATTAAVCR